MGWSSAAPRKEGEPEPEPEGEPEGEGAQEGVFPYDLSKVKFECETRVGDEVAFDVLRIKRPQLGIHTLDPPVGLASLFKNH